MANDSRYSVSHNTGGAVLDDDISAPPILTTKLYRPPRTPHLRQRNRLIEPLELNRKRPLTLISAPAGYGKTILASMWLESSDYASAWLSLDKEDNDLITFVRYLLAAVKGTFPDLELKTQALLDAPSLPSVPVLARYLLNDLDQIQQPLILALDDFHLITEQAIFEFVCQLLRHPPRGLHLALIGRHTPPLPIASLRAQGQVTEVGASELRFTPQETAGLLGWMLDRDIDQAVAEEWTEKTEGWVTALRLAGLSLRHRGLVDDLRTAVQVDSRYLRDYLLAEVLAHLPAAHQAWLLKTAVLDRFCAPLCEAVCQAGADCAETGIDGEEFIAWLQSENLFLVPLDARHEWFRFHHLFQRLLQAKLEAQLPADEVDAVRMAASRWCAENGLLDEALQYALAAGDAPGAVKLVEQHRYHLMNTEQWHRLERWLKLLPVDAVAQSPLLMTTRAFLGVHRGQNREVVVGAQEAERLVATLPPEPAMVQRVRAETGILQGLLDVIGGNPARAIASVQKSLELLPAQAVYIRSVATGVVAVGLQMQGDLEQGVAVIREALADPVWPAGLHAKIAHYLCLAFLQEGDLTGVLRLAREYLPVAEQHQLGESLSWMRYNLGIAHYLRNEFAEAEPYLVTLLEDRARSAPSYVAVGAYALALLFHARNRVSDAEQVIDFVRNYVGTLKDTFSWTITRFFPIELALRQGKLDEARRHSTSVDFDLRPPAWFFYVPQLTSIKLLLAEGTGSSLDEAGARLAVLEAEMRRINRKNVLIDVLALQALVCDAQGDEQTAFEKLTAALDLGIVGENVRCFADLGPPMAKLLHRFLDLCAGRGFSDNSDRYVYQILSAFPEKTAGTPLEQVAPRSGYLASTLTLVEPLTKRERQTLRLLATDLSTEEIAAELCVANATVHTYSKRIYGKLEAHSRFEAVQRAMELGLL